MNSSYTVEAVLKATGVEKFTKSFESASKQINGVAEHAKKSTSGIKGMMSGVGKIAGGIGVTKALSAGFNAIKNSVGDAVSRVDTLNQFPKMMESMGFSAGEADAAIALLSDGIQGLPTKLDDVTATAQNIAIMTGDLEGATETTLALNNAFLASGSSSADAERGLTQYTQMLSKGEVDMQSWRTLQETMGVALNDTAKAFGFAGESAQNDLYAALQDGSITFDDFNDKIIELDEGVGGFAERALIGSEGIATSMQNIKTAIGTGIANSIQAVDEAMQAGGFGSIAENLDKVKATVQSAFKAITLAAGPAVEMIVRVVGVFQEMKNKIKAAFQELFPDFDLFKNKIQGVWEAIKIAFSQGNMESVGDSFKYMFSLIFQYIEEALPKLLENGMDMITNIIEGITTTVPELYKKGIEFMVMFYEVLADFLPKLLKMGMKFVTSLLKGLAKKFPEWISMAVDMGVELLGTLSENLPKLLAKGVEMLSKLAQGFRNNFPDMLNAAAQMIAKLLGAILANLPKLLSAGIKLIAKLAVGLIKAIPKVLRAMGDIARGITSAVKDISLLNAGKAIINGFVKGLKSAWQAGKDFIGGIGGWIQRNKGPISKDKKLLIDAGNAIMDGLNKGLEKSFPEVQRTVSGMGQAIQDSFNSQPSLNVAGAITGSNAQVQSAVSGKLNAGYNTGVRGFNSDKKNREIIQNITINSPDPTSPSDNARKMKQASRELAKGW